jgi:excisionase family DNA binding protein
MQSTVNDQLLTAHQVADRLNVCVATVRTLVRAQKLPVVRLSRRALRFRNEDVEALTAGAVEGSQVAVCN